MLDVWYALATAIAPQALDAAEQARARRFLCAQAETTHRAAHALKRRVLSHYRPDVDPAAWRFRENRWGKPAVAMPPAALVFNLSHSGDTVAVIVADGDAEIGVDIERLRPLPHADDVATHVFHPDELRWLARQRDMLPAFFRLWTLKESLLKAVGTGFSHPARQICWHMLDTPSPQAEFGGRIWHGATRVIDGAILSIAVPSASDIDDARLLRLGPDGASPRPHSMRPALHPIIEPLLGATVMPPSPVATLSMHRPGSLAT